jgi:hypothetical protein
LVDRAAERFEDGRQRRAAAAEEPSVKEPYAQIGRLKMQVEWLKKVVAAPLSVRRTLVHSSDPYWSVRQQCDLLSVNRSTY